MIQINLPIPQTCLDCFALDDTGDYAYCMISQTSQGYKFKPAEKRMPNCPLKEIPKETCSFYNPDYAFESSCGWIYPKCGRVYSPLTTMCFYCPEKTKTTTSITVGET